MEGYAVVDVYLDQFGKVEYREYWWEPVNGRPERITAWKYAELIEKGLPYRVNAYCPVDQDDDD